MSGESGRSPAGYDVTAPVARVAAATSNGYHPEPTVPMRPTPIAACLLLALSACEELAGPALPAVHITAPVNGTRNLTGTVSVTATATDDDGIAEVEFQLDGATIAQVLTGPYTTDINTAAHTTGAHVIRVRARDGAGNLSGWVSHTVTFGGDVDLPAGFTQAPYVQGLAARATAAAFAPDGRLFVAEQTGALRVVSGGTLLPTPFVSLAVLSAGERGLLGVALDPDFDLNNFVYVYYTTAEGGAHNRISRFTASGNVAAGGSEVILADLPPLSTATNHNGGALAFGPDDKLYVAVGDNAQILAPQSVATTLGKILRFNPDGSIPADNPFLATTAGQARAIWALGLRNPYTIAFHPGTGRLHINDVGQDTWEEVNLGRAGANYGWPNFEGPTTAAGLDSPWFAYRHTNSPTLFEGGAIVGGAFYYPAVNLFGAAYADDYFFADYVSGWIYRMDVPDTDGAYAFARTGGNPSGLLVGPDGALYVLLGTGVDRIAP